MRGETGRQFVHRIDTREFRRSARGAAADRPAHGIDPFDPMRPRSVQHGQRVVGEQRALRVEWLDARESRPEIGRFLGRAEREGRVDRVEMSADAELRILDRQDLRVCVRDQAI